MPSKGSKQTKTDAVEALKKAEEQIAAKARVLIRCFEWRSFGHICIFLYRYTHKIVVPGLSCMCTGERVEHIEGALCSCEIRGRWNPCNFWTEHSRLESLGIIFRWRASPSNWRRMVAWDFISRSLLWWNDWWYIRSHVDHLQWKPSCGPRRTWRHRTKIMRIVFCISSCNQWMIDTRSLVLRYSY